MKTIIAYLDDLKEIFGSDNKSAEALGIDRTTIANIRKRGQLSEETAIKVADALGIDRGEILIAAAMARSEGEVKTAWNAVAKKAGMIAAGVLLCYGLAITSGENSTAEASETVSNIHYAKSLVVLVVALMWFIWSRKHEEKKQLLSHQMEPCRH